MLLSEFDFPFDPSLIATEPVTPRDHARLLIVDRKREAFTHQHVSDLPAWLRKGDLVVVNDTRVLAARMRGRKRPGGGLLDCLFVQDLGDDVWEVFAKGNLKPGQVIELAGQSQATVLERGPTRTTMRVEGARPFRELMRDVGHMPLPPYIKRQPMQADHEWYQTVFAREEGAIAAPTAGLHFTDSLLNILQQQGVRLATVTLHVGPGTFRPVTVEQIEHHRMGVERVDVPEIAVEMVRKTKAEKGRVVAVGTTVVRALEAAGDGAGSLRPFKGETNLFVSPGFQFRVVDALLTNFHLPRTTLLMLVSAFSGLDRLRRSYEEAVRSGYRFYSYGDAMLIL